MRRKIHPLKIKKLKRLYDEGMPVKEISECLDIAVSTIYYYVNASYRKKHLKRCSNYFKCLPKEKKKEAQVKAREYQRLYHKNRYQNDPEFRLKQISCSMKFKQAVKEVSMPRH
tara:strand:+ start:1908 stop:2249 length:342 start_codon:yes stop_codon:yes gene_type:complete